MKNRLLSAILILSSLHASAQREVLNGQQTVKNYCPSFATNSSYEWIQRVSVGNEGNTSGNNNGYGNFTNIDMHVKTGKGYFVSLTAGRLSSSYTEHWTVYIDYNNDGDFDEANETIAKGITKSLDSVKIYFIVPEHAKICTTRMRVQMAYATAVTDPCSFYEFGEVEDYNVKISCASPHELAGIDTSSCIPVVLQVFPNPVKNVSVAVSMQLQRKGKIVFKISDLSGKPLLMQAFTSSTSGKNVFTVNVVDKLNRGVFMLTAEQDGKIIGRTQLVVE